MTAATDGALFTGAEHVTERAAEYDERLALVRTALATFGPGVVSPRAARDEAGDAARRIAGARAYLAGEYDRTYCRAPHMGESWATLENWRAHYGSDALDGALHHLVWAEHYAGLRTRESAAGLDPWRR